MGEGGCWVSANENSCEHGAQINFGDITPYLTHDQGVWSVVDFLKLRQIRTHEVHLRGFPFMAGLVGSVQETTCIPDLGWSWDWYKRIFSLPVAILAASRLSVNVSLMFALMLAYQKHQGKGF
jgi:hypothetical protein